jgi:hypothetical protein
MWRRDEEDVGEVLNWEKMWEVEEREKDERHGY